MKQETNKTGRVSSLLSVVFLTLFSILIFGVGLLWFFNMLGFEGIAAGLIATQASIALLALAFFRFNIKDLISTISFKLKTNHVIITLVSVVSAIGFNIVIATLTDVLNLNRDKVDEYISGTTEAYAADGGILLMFIMPIIVAPIVEELAFRAGLKKVLVDDSKWKPYQYVIISGLIFGLLHSQPGLFSISPVLITGFIGIINSIVYLRTKNILYPIIIHMLYNLIITYAASIAV